MMNTTALITFLTALFFLEITPGPDMMLVLARGIGQGWQFIPLAMSQIDLCPHHHQTSTGSHQRPIATRRYSPSALPPKISDSIIGRP